MSERSETRVAALILAAGVGSRMGSKITKQRMLLLDKSILYRTVSAFERCGAVDSITVVVREDEVDFAKGELSQFNKVINIVIGGKTRAESARIGFESCRSKCDYIAIHDGARCLITPDMIGAVIDGAKKYGCATAVSRIYDTVKTVDKEGFILATEDRENLRRASTPQVFDAKLYERALNNIASSEEITDDNMLLEKSGEAVYTVDVGGENLKITTMQDLKYAEFLLKERGEGDV